MPKYVFKPPAVPSKKPTIGPTEALRAVMARKITNPHTNQKVTVLEALLLKLREHVIAGDPRAIKLAIEIFSETDRRTQNFIRPPPKSAVETDTQFQERLQRLLEKITSGAKPADVEEE